MTTPFSSILIMFGAAFIGSFGSAFLKAGAVRLGGGIRGLVTNWRLPAGIAAYLGSSALFVVGMRHGELSVLYPMIALGYVFTLIWSRLFFAERITVMKIAGVGLILTGIVCLASGNR
jgi:multidrug transporter EmrE-like cation transporter